MAFVPFIVLAVGFPSFLQTERFLFYGVVPLILVPITLAGVSLWLVYGLLTAGAFAWLWPEIPTG